MNIEYDDKGQLKINAFELFEYLPKEKLLEFIESFSCIDEVIKHVTMQIIEGWTENYYHGGTACMASSTPLRGLDWATREVAKHSGEVAKKEIERLEAALASKTKDLQDLREEIYNQRQRY